jgi:predicted oxidoreductase
MRITGRGIWGEPPDQARAVLRRAVELGVNFIDTADAYGPKVSEELIATSLSGRSGRRHQGSTRTAACLVTIGLAGVVVSSSRRATAPLPERRWATSTNGS